MVAQKKEKPKEAELFLKHFWMLLKIGFLGGIMWLSLKLIQGIIGSTILMIDLINLSLPLLTKLMKEDPLVLLLLSLVSMWISLSIVSMFITIIFKIWNNIKKEENK